MQPQTGEPDLVIIKLAPLNGETPAEALRHAETPTRHVYVRTNFGVPALGAEHRIEVGGAVARPLALAVDELRRLPQRAVLVTTECAGNDRVGMRPLPAGEPWRSGAVSTARWTGVPLARLLADAGHDPAAVEVLVTGADTGPRADADDPVRPVAFARSLPLADALAPDVLLALALNGEPLPPAYGAPARLVVPGWYGMASVKWVARVDVLTEPYAGYFQRRRYVYEAADGVRPVTRMRVKSAIVAPAEGARVAAGRVRVWGWAWSGHGAVTRVAVSPAGDAPWQDAALAPPASPHAWTPWELELDLAPGRHVLRSRATDASGAAQPDEPSWNRLGYGNNAVRPVVIDVG
jgi:DMSO/TMAO reductase YedYZ molybdopterin-dependent catalytic subunit